MKTGILLSAALTMVLSVACGPAAGVKAGWISTDEKYSPGTCPESFAENGFTTPVWKNDRANAEVFVWSEEAMLPKVTVSVSDLKCGSSVIPSESISVGAVKYVISDIVPKYKTGYRENLPDSTFVADLIDLEPYAEVNPTEGRPFWIKVEVPQDADAGVYEGKVTIKGKGLGCIKLPVSLEVADRVLPDPHDWKFHLDLWQNPFAIAREAGVELWSDEHFARMVPYYETLAAAGQKVITATVLNRPWNGQTYDAFGPMVVKTLKADGSWVYDYSVFDKWVEFMMGLGIDRQINCYSLIPWHMTFDYFDEASGQNTDIVAQADSKEFKWYWGSFLADFSKHLESKGWLGITTIAMDERPRDVMAQAKALIAEFAPALKVSLAGYKPDTIQDGIYDLSLAYPAPYTPEIVAQRHAEGLLSTLYTCCGPRFPNTLTESSLGECAYMGWFIASQDLDGYLRWAFNSWGPDVLKDARYNIGSWSAGDTYLIYPGPRSCIRFEKLLEGIKAYEKIHILREGASEETLEEIEDILSPFYTECLNESYGLAAAQMVRTANEKLSRLY